MTLLLCIVLCLMPLAAAGAQTPAQPPAAPPPASKPQPQPPPAAKPQPPVQTKQPRPAAAGLTMSIHVTDRSGNSLQGARVTVSGPSDRAGETGQDGRIDFRGLRAGTYRIRFEHDRFITLEREVLVRTGPADVSAALSAAPAPPQPEPVASPPLPPPAPPKPSRAVDPHSVSIADYLDTNLIRSEPQKTSLLACADGGTAVLLQIREPIANRQHADADELLYVVAGEGALRLGGRETRLRPAHFALVPRGMAYGLRREGRNPVILVSILAGSPCTETGPPVK